MGGMGIRNHKVKISIISVILVLSAILFFNPLLAEGLYGNGIYFIIRSFFHVFSFIPIPLIYFLLLLLIFGILKAFRSKVTVVSTLKKTAIGCFIIVWLFYFLWAFNYSRPSFNSKFPLQKEKMDSIAWNEELLFARQQIVVKRPHLLTTYTTREIEQKVREHVRTICSKYEYNAPGKIRVKSLWPKGSLLRIGTAGFYLPFAGEAYIDPGLVFIQKPFTLAHEMCHGYGVTDEGACNFLAYLALIHHPDSTINYSSQLAYFRTIASEYRWRYPDNYKRIRDSLPLLIKSDLDEINANFSKYPDIFPRLRQNIYDNYLKIQGIREGMANYENIIGYVRQGRKNGTLKF